MRSKVRRRGEKHPLAPAFFAGEPLTPEVITWAEETFGNPVRDHYGQTEHGMMIFNAWHDDIRTDLQSGSIGRPIPGWSFAVLQDNIDEPAGPGEIGRVAVDVAEGPLMWSRAAKVPGKIAERLNLDGRWYLTGDAGKIEEDGNYYFSSRGDGVIIIAGYRIDPFAVESILAGHPSVQECAVIGPPDDSVAMFSKLMRFSPMGLDGSEDMVVKPQSWLGPSSLAHAYPARFTSLMICQPEMGAVTLSRPLRLHLIEQFFGCDRPGLHPFRAPTELTISWQPGTRCRSSPDDVF
ncbi:AMP-binding protein [Paenarthrobacter sp. YIM B13468]|uniref:AMP-binding protein n=1 Tax=Paenarthrobacter sp. YIM B13468 TaxID=3366295 RepID=UPI00366C7E45